MSAMNIAQEKGKLSPYEATALADWKKGNARFKALREAYRLKTPLAAWETVGCNIFEFSFRFRFNTILTDSHVTVCHV
jgi:hypothetical protein